MGLQSTVCPHPAGIPVWISLLLQVFYSIRSERHLMERLEFDVLFRWFVGIDGDGPPADAGSRNRAADFHGEKRSNETHASTTDPEARHYPKGPGKEAQLCFMGQVLMENRNGLWSTPVRPGPTAGLRRRT